MGQTVTLVNTTANATVQTGDKFRCTWQWVLSEFGSGAFFDSRRFDLNVQAALPGMGFIPASAPAATPGDEVIVYDVRLNNSWGVGKKVSDVVAALDDLPFIEDTALDVVRLEKIPATTGSVALDQGQEAARDEGNTQSQLAREQGGLFPSITSMLRSVGVITALAVVAVAAVVAYRWRKS